MGGSSGTVYAWDLRWQQQAITLAGAGLEAKSQPLSGSEVWEVKYDAFTPQISSTKVLPVMMCSEDGFLAVLRQGMMLYSPQNFICLIQYTLLDLVCAF